MSNITIEKTVDNNLCCSCGICKAVCPKFCIEYKKNMGQYVPIIDKEQCIKCGLCLELCPGIHTNYKQIYKNLGQEYPKDIFVGNYIYCLNAFSRDEQIRKNGTSGGVITNIIQYLLKEKKYDCAFLVDTFNYDKQVDVNKYDCIDDYKNISKSRYVSVSQANLIKHIIEYPTEKIIVVAVGCTVYGITKIIQKYKLNRNNYLILGLFCDNSLSYYIFDYFNQNNQLKDLYFRNKEKSGWPGDVKLILKNGEEKYYPAQKRQEVKRYFQLERCCYCIDKLNQLADISIGDNYTSHNKDIKGTNSLIIRTQQGKQIIEEMRDKIESYPISIEEIYQAQKIDIKKKQVDNIKILYKNTNISVCDDITSDSRQINNKNTKLYKRKLKDIGIGKQYSAKPYKLYVSLHYVRLKNMIKKTIKNILSNIIRR